jgi:hypothetical protein
MFEIVLLIIVTAGIVGYARGRGGTPWLWGTLTVVGYFLVPFLVVFFAARFGADRQTLIENRQLWFFASAACWVAILAFGARFLLGRSYDKPDSLWNCPNCHDRNQRYAVICEA